jgi:hypothetical protein
MLGALALHPRPSSALRRSAAPGAAGRAGTGCARAGGFGALGYSATQREIHSGQAVHSRARSNPSVKRTHNGGAQWLASATSAAPSCAAYLER